MPLVRGRVVNALDHPVAGARIMVASGPALSPDIALLTDREGHFTLELPAPGTWTLVVATDEASVSTTVDAGPAGTDLRIDLPAP